MGEREAFLSGEAGGGFSRGARGQEQCSKIHPLTLGAGVTRSLAGSASAHDSLSPH